MGSFAYTTDNASQSRSGTDTKNPFDPAVLSGCFFTLVRTQASSTKSTSPTKAHTLHLENNKSSLQLDNYQGVDAPTGILYRISQSPP